MNAAVSRLPPPRLDRLVRDIEAAIASGDGARQSELVLRSADALTRRWSRLPAEDKPGFDRLLAGLLGQVDEAARAAFAARLAPLRRAPRLTATRLARDASMRVAGPLLETCPSFDEAWLLEIVASCGEAHRRAVARRPMLGAALSAALIRTGGPEVVAALLGNPGAVVAAEALPPLLRLAAGSEAVALALGARADLPAPARADLIDLARRRARAGLERDGAFDAAAIEDLLADVARVFAASVAPERAARFAGAMAVADGVFGTAPLAAARIERWIEMRRVEDVLAALARDAGLPVAVLVACHDAAEATGLVVALRALGLPWPTLKALLRARHGGAPDPDLLARAHWLHAGLSASSARRLARYAATRLGLSAFPPVAPDRPPDPAPP